jgi:hypothetical protein
VRGWPTSSALQEAARAAGEPIPLHLPADTLLFTAPAGQVSLLFAFGFLIDLLS